jgi:Protein of unknown function (DUF2034)
MLARPPVPTSTRRLLPLRISRSYRTKAPAAPLKPAEPSKKESKTSSASPRGRYRNASPVPSKIPIRASVASTCDPTHHDLESFLRYAENPGVSRKSTVFQGTLYEYVVLSSLRRLGFGLRRVGGAHDLGIDLIGHWHVPSSPTPIRVLVQCKANGQSLNPENVRGLEGAFDGAPEGHRGQGVIAWLVGKHAASRGVQSALTGARMPMGFVQIEGHSGLVKQVLWNHEARQWGLEGLGVTTKYVDCHETFTTEEVVRPEFAKALESGEKASKSKSKGGDATEWSGGLSTEIVLTWEGWTIQRSPDTGVVTPSSDNEKKWRKSSTKGTTGTKATAKKTAVKKTAADKTTAKARPV